MIRHPDYPEHGFAYRVLAYRVLAVAAVHFGPKLWAVYLGAVNGRNYDREWLDVYRGGDKLSEAMGRLIFPELCEDDLKWRV